ncbi:MAG: tail fiber protein [Clostridia bacterium]|jgi:hypothetical protein|nr:tail fiber protein [Clostridia bacterium]
MDYTSNFNLKKPEQTDFYNVSDFNDNADIIDTKLKANADAASGAESKAKAALPESDFTGANVLAKMAADKSVVPVKNGGTGASSSSSALSNLGGLSKSGGTMAGDIIMGTNKVKYNSSGQTYMHLWGNDAEGLAKTNNVDIGSWQGVSFSNTCSTGPVSKGSPAVSISTRSGNIYLTGDIKTADGKNYVQSLLTGGKISVVKSIQRGYCTSSTATINAVNTSKSILIINSHSECLNNGVSNNNKYYLPSATLANSTTITFDYVHDNGGDHYYNYEWQVIEFY